MFPIDRQAALVLAAGEFLAWRSGGVLNRSTLSMRRRESEIEGDAHPKACPKFLLFI